MAPRKTTPENDTPENTPPEGAPENNTPPEGDGETPPVEPVEKTWNVTAYTKEPGSRRHTKLWSKRVTNTLPEILGHHHDGMTAAMERGKDTPNKITKFEIEIAEEDILGGEYD